MNNNWQSDKHFYYLKTSLTLAKSPSRSLIPSKVGDYYRQPSEAVNYFKVINYYPEKEVDPYEYDLCAAIIDKLISEYGQSFPKVYRGIKKRFSTADAILSGHLKADTASDSAVPYNSGVGFIKFYNNVRGLKVSHLCHDFPLILFNAKSVKEWG